LLEGAWQFAFFANPLDPRSQTNSVQKEGRMPRVIVKLLAGRSEELKSKLGEELTKAIMIALSSEADSISVAIEDVKSGDWTKTVYETIFSAIRTRSTRSPATNRSEQARDPRALW
jgi:4-oxalocrotonate tautomerase